MLVLRTSSFINQSEDLTEASENPGSPHFSQVFPRFFSISPGFSPGFSPFLDPQKTAGPTVFFAPVQASASADTFDSQLLIRWSFQATYSWGHHVQYIYISIYIYTYVLSFMDIYIYIHVYI